MTRSPAAPLRLAVQDADGWTELTAPAQPVDRITRIRAASLSEAARLAATAPRPAFLDVEVLLAPSVREAYADFRRLRPGWSPGARTAVISHPGTVATLAGLLWDVWAAGVAPGVTLLADDPEALTAVVLTRVLPLLETHGLRLDRAA